MSSVDISQILAQSTQRLTPFFDSARLDAEVLVAHVLNLSRTQLYTWADKVISDVDRANISRLIDRRSEGEPVAYIVGCREFWSLEFKVTTDTLIPRPETEHLVEFVLENISPNEKCRLADLGTGSGAIAIAIAKERPLCQIIAVDKSVAALKVAIDNARNLAVANVTFKQSNWFGSLHGEIFDLLISNPPYVEEKDKNMSKGDVVHEPLSALVSGSDGLDDIRHIIKRAKHYLKPGCSLVLEHGFAQGARVRAIFSAEFYDNVCSHHDLAGIERLTVGCYTHSDIQN